jgi:hypothetical protein
MQALLKFCLEATRGEDAPQSDVESMDEERRQWLQVSMCRHYLENAMASHISAGNFLPFEGFKDTVAFLGGSEMQLLYIRGTY